MPLAKITGTLAGQQALQNANIDPFATVVITDPNGLTDFVDFALSAPAGGTLRGAGLVPIGLPGAGAYELIASAAAVTAAEQGVVFHPTVGGPGACVTTTFTISDTNTGPTGGTTAPDNTTTVADIVAPLSTISGTVAGQTTANNTAIDPFAGVVMTAIWAMGGADGTTTLGGGLTTANAGPTSKAFGLVGSASRV